MTIQNRIKEYRQKGGITQEQLAESVGVSRQTVVAMEKGNYIPSLLLAMRLSQIFKTKVEDLFFIQ